MGNSLLKKRIDWIDYAKGFGMILVIIGHTVLNYATGSFVRGAIYSFHMPLFFILSCVTSKFSNDIDEWKTKVNKSFKHLMVPAFLVLAFEVVYAVIKDPSLITNFGYWYDRFYSFIFASGVSLEALGQEIKPMGIPWFFFVLFIGRNLFDYIHLKLGEDKLFVSCAVLSLIGVLIGQNDWLIFSLDICLAIMPLFYFGYKLKSFKVEEKPLKKLVIFGIVWLVTLIIQFPNVYEWTYMELACRRYALFPLCFVTACAGTMVVVEFSYMFSKLGKIVSPIKFLGKESMYFLLIHCLDGMWWKLWTVENHQFATACLRFLVDLGIFLVVIGTIYLFRYLKNKSKKSKTT